MATVIGGEERGGEERGGEKRGGEEREGRKRRGGKGENGLYVVTCELASFSGYSPSDDTWGGSWEQH